MQDTKVTSSLFSTAQVMWRWNFNDIFAFLWSSQTGSRAIVQRWSCYCDDFYKSKLSRTALTV